MIAFPTMLVGAAVEAGIKVPENPDLWKENKADFPHFYAFCITQLARPMRSFTEHWDNAKVIASVSETDILLVSITDLINMGLSI